MQKLFLPPVPLNSGLHGRSTVVATSVEPFKAGNTRLFGHRGTLEGLNLSDSNFFMNSTVRYTGWLFGLWDFFGKFDWDIFDEITSNIGVITLVASFCCGRRPQKRIWWVIIQSKEILITNTPTITSYSLPPTEDQPENQLITRNSQFHIWWDLKTVGLTVEKEWVFWKCGHFWKMDILSFFKGKCKTP